MRTTRPFRSGAKLIASIDNGINIAAETAYSQQTDLSARVRRLNPRWNEPTSDTVYDVGRFICNRSLLLTVTGKIRSSFENHRRRVPKPARRVCRSMATSSRYRPSFPRQTIRSRPERFRPRFQPGRTMERPPLQHRTHPFSSVQDPIRSLP